MAVPTLGVQLQPQDFFTNLKAAVVDLRPVLNGPIDASVVQFFRRQFLSEGKAGGTPWAPLRPATVRAKRRANRRNMGALRFSNRLWASLTKRTGPNVVLNVTDDRYERGTDDPKALPHQEGFRQMTAFGKPRKHPLRVPPRPLVPDELPATLLSAWEKFVAKHIEEKARGR